MTSTKTDDHKKVIKQYCSVCKDSFDMEVVKQDTGQSVVWLKCPGCEGFLPHTPDEEAEKDVARQPETELALEDLDVESAKDYTDADVYEIGDVVHHRSWSDFGKVISKGELPGNRKTIWVQFLRQGKIQLLEGVE